MRRRSRKRKRFSNIPACLMLMIMILSALPLTGLTFVRADTYVSDRTGSICAVLMSQPDQNGKNVLYSNVNMKLYQVGTVSENSGKVIFQLDSRFENSGIGMETLTTANKWAAAAQTLAKMAGSSGVKSVEGTSGAQGEILYENLSQGLYLLVQNSAQDQLIISPSLLTVPMQEDGQWIYDEKVYPKFQPDQKKDNTEKIINTINTIQTVNTGNVQRNTLTREVTDTSVKTVKTGDDTQILSWSVILVIAFAGIIIVYLIRKRKNKDKTKMK